MKQPIDIKTNEDGTIVIKFIGDLLEADIDAFKASVDMGKVIIKKICDQQKRKVRILLDVQEFSGKYCGEAVDVLAHFAKDNKEYVEKTASFGGSANTRSVGEMITMLSERENIQVFETEKEALEWLKESKAAL